MKVNKCGLWMISLLLVCSVLGCNQNGTDQRQEDEGCPVVSVPPISESLDTLNIIIETSGSMAGFMPARGGNQTNFQQQVDNILANAESLEGNAIKQLRYYSAREKMYKEVYSRFSQMLRNGLRTVGSSSPIPQMLNNISSNHLGPGQVTIFISDFIYAPPNQRDRNFIANDIRRALNIGRQKNFVVSVFAAQSDFSGTFYPADAKSSPIRNCCSTDIPYYLWVMGPEEKVRLVNQEVIRSNFLEQVHFGFSPHQPAYTVIPGSGRRGEWYPGDREGKRLKLDNAADIKRSGISYTVGINLASLPGQVLSNDYLMKNLQLRVNNGEAKVSEIFDQAQFLRQEGINNKDRKLINCFTHFVKIDVGQVFEINSNVEVAMVLNNKLPTWIDDYSTENDSQIEEEGAKTFSLNAIMEGARRATGGPSGEFFNLKTTVDISR